MRFTESQSCHRSWKPAGTGSALTKAQLVLHPHPLRVEVGGHELQLLLCLQVAGFE